MAIRYYDDALVMKLKKWIPDGSKLRVLKPDETKRLFETQADDNNDQPLQLPIVALSRSTDIELLNTSKQEKSFNGLKLLSNHDETLKMNVIPIKPEYQLDIYTKTYDEGDEYLRNFLFKLINNPAIIIEIPYNNTQVQHIANIRVLSTASDTSDISERIFPGQFTRWTLQLEIQDAFLFSLPYKRNWKIDGIMLEMSESLEVDGIQEEIEKPAPFYYWSEDYTFCKASYLPPGATEKIVEVAEGSQITYTITRKENKTKGWKELGFYTAKFNNDIFETQKTNNIMKKNYTNVTNQQENNLDENN